MFVPGSVNNCINFTVNISHIMADVGWPKLFALHLIVLICNSQKDYFKYCDRKIHLILKRFFVPICLFSCFKFSVASFQLLPSI